MQNPDRQISLSDPTQLAFVDEDPTLETVIGRVVENRAKDSSVGDISRMASRH